MVIRQTEARLAARALELAEIEAAIAAVSLSRVAAVSLTSRPAGSSPDAVAPSAVATEQPPAQPEDETEMEWPAGWDLERALSAIALIDEQFPDEEAGVPDVNHRLEMAEIDDARAERYLSQMHRVDRKIWAWLRIVDGDEPQAPPLQEWIN